MSLEEICDNFFNDNKALSSSVLISFQKQNSSMKLTNKTSVINYVKNSKEFQEHFKNIFQECYFKMFPSGLKEHYDDFVQDFMNTILIKNQGFSIYNVEEYFKQCEYFDNYFGQMTKNVYSFYYTNEVDNDTLNTCVHAIKQLDFINNTKKDIQIKVENIIKNLHVFSNDKSTKASSFKVEEEYKQYYCDKYHSHFNEIPDVENVNEFQSFVENKKTIVDLYFMYKHKDYSIFFNQILNLFRSIFQRDITIYEYVKYYDEFSNDTQMKIENYKKTFDERFTKMKNIYKSYLDENLDISCFCEKYLEFMDVDINTYEESMINIIIQYDSYQKVMSIKIKSVYSDIFNTDLLDRDMMYYFEQISKNKISLISEHLSKQIVLIKEETDNYVQTINDIYEKILRRPSIGIEIEKAIVYFRYKNTSNIKPNIHLENILFECLEYHDVLKDIITEHFGGGSTCERTRVYDVLARILHNDDRDVKRDKTKIIQLIDQAYDLS